MKILGRCAKCLSPLEAIFADFMRNLIIAQEAAAKTGKDMVVLCEKCNFENEAERERPK